MLVLALVFLVVLVAPLVVDLPAAARTAFSAADLAIWPAFAVDYGVRLYLAPARWHFVRTHPLDLIVLALPMLRPLRALRLLRPARLGAIAGVAHRRAQRSLHATVAGYVTTSAAGLLVLAAAVMYDVERRAPAGNIKSFPDALWWAVTTVTTVGYGDRYPTTGAGRLVGGALMLVGIALLGVVTASIAAWFVGRLRDVEVAEQSTQATLAEILAVLQALHARAGRPGATSSAQRLRRHGPPGRRLASRWREPVKRAALLLLLPLAACSTPTPAAAPPNPPSQPSQMPGTASALSRPSSAAPPALPSSSLPVAPSPTRTAGAGRTATAAPAPPLVTSSGALCHPRAVPGGVLPDAACTPGTANPDATQATIGSTICRAGYTATIRPPASYTDALKRQQIVAYGYPDTDPRLRGGSPDRAGTGRRAQRSAQPLVGAGALAEPEGQGRERVAPASLRRLADAGRGATADRHRLDDRRPLSPSRLRPATNDDDLAPGPSNDRLRSGC